MHLRILERAPVQHQIPCNMEISSVSPSVSQSVSQSVCLFVSVFSFFPSHFFGGRLDFFLAALRAPPLIPPPFKRGEGISGCNGWGYARRLRIKFTSLKTVCSKCTVSSFRGAHSLSCTATPCRRSGMPVPRSPPPTPSPSPLLAYPRPQLPSHPFTACLPWRVWVWVWGALGRSKRNRNR